MPEIFEMAGRRGERMIGTSHDHDEVEYMATSTRATTENPRLSYTPRLRTEATDVLLDIKPGKAF